MKQHHMKSTLHPLRILSSRGFSLVGGIVVGLALAATASAGDIRVLETKVDGGVPSANNKTVNGTPVFPDTIVPPRFSLSLIAEGLDLLENPSGTITRFGFLSDMNNTKTEPDQNLYLVLDHNPGGPTAGYDYGRHFLFQGHENANNQAYVTRINLDVANPDHRITLLTPGAQGVTMFNRIDGSAWNPFSKTLLFTQEGDSTNGGVIEMSSDFDPVTGGGGGLRTLYGSMGRGGHEGIHPDDLGNIFIVEDIGGTTLGASANPGNKAKNPNSFVYRFVSKNPRDLSAGKLQALQVTIHGSPLTFVPVDATHPTGDVLSANQLNLHTLGTSWPVKWVTVHDTDVQGTAPFDSNAAAKAAGATPFKRPENGAFVPDSKFQSFVFAITGDTEAIAGNQPELAARGAWGGVFRVDLNKNRDAGTISILVLGDADHASFDNVTFADKDVLLLTEDRGDTLHNQLNKLDSCWAYDIQGHVSSARLVALGQDRMATAEDNEPTGLHFSSGDSSVRGLLGAKSPEHDGLLFFTQQHGENNLYQIVGCPGGRDEDGRDW
jgi:hypothetical protein